VKKFLSLLLALICVFACLSPLPIEAQAATEGYYTYEVYSGHVSITEVDTTISGAITIPSTLGGYPVTDIGSWAFNRCTGLTSVTIPDGVTSIGSAAFYDCTSLTSVTIPESVTDIYWGAFTNCTSLTSVSIPDSVINIEGEAFYGCTSLTSVNIPDSITGITFFMFGDCTSLTSVTIPDGITFIDVQAFACCTSLTSVTIPDGVTAIGGSAFMLCTNLQSIIIPDGVTKISWSAFDGCTNLTSVTIPDSVISIEERAFYECTSLTSITIPNSVTSIGEYAFRSCSSLTSITIPNSVTDIGWDAFKGCSELTDVYYTGTQEQWEQIIISEDNDPLINATIHFNAFPEEDFVNGKVDSWGVVLKENIGVSFQMKFTDEILADNDAYVEIVVDDLKTTIPVSQAIESVSAELNAAQMTEPVTLTVVAGDGTRGESQTYTVRQYAQYILNGDYDDATKQLIKEMLHYGAAAQVYFDYNADDLANAEITDVAATDVPKTAEKVTVSDQISNVNFYGASLVYRDRIAVRYYFTGDVAGCTFTANGNTYTPVAKDGMHYVEVADILPQNLDQAITMTVTDASDNTLTVSYSPMNYIVRMNEKGSDTLKALVKALYNYHLAAKALRA